jgi:hypothetical protein
VKRPMRGGSSAARNLMESFENVVVVPAPQTGNAQGTIIGYDSSSSEYRIQLYTGVTEDVETSRIIPYRNGARDVSQGTRDILQSGNLPLHTQVELRPIDSGYETDVDSGYETEVGDD